MKKTPTTQMKKPKLLRKSRLLTAFDTETTGLIENITVKDDKLPEVIEFYGCLLDVDSGKIIEELDLLIKPTIAKKLPDDPNWKVPITWDMLKDKKSFDRHYIDIKMILEKAPIVVAHNAAFDKEVIDVEVSRVDGNINWPFVMCTVEQTMHLKGYRLSLTALHELLFNEAFPDAHRASIDVKAMCRCIVELIKREEIIYHG